MYLYSLNDYNSNTVLAHDRKISQEEFGSMCHEAKRENVGKYEFYNGESIAEHLIGNKGFKEVEYQAGLFLG